MTISSTLFAVLVVVALVLVVAAPMILVTLLIRDWRGNKLW